MKAVLSDRSGIIASKKYCSMNENDNVLPTFRGVEYRTPARSIWRSGTINLRWGAFSCQVSNLCFLSLISQEIRTFDHHVDDGRSRGYALGDLDMVLVVGFLHPKPGKLANICLS
jgi:hypothetical protein